MSSSCSQSQLFLPLRLRACRAVSTCCQSLHGEKVEDSPTTPTCNRGLGGSSTTHPWVWAGGNQSKETACFTLRGWAFQRSASAHIFALQAAPEQGNQRARCARRDSSRPQLDSRLACPQGTVAEGRESSTCNSCEEGHCSNDTGMTACVVCGTGWFSGHLESSTWQARRSPVGGRG